MARLDARTKVQVLVDFADYLRDNGPASAWAVALHLERDPKRAYLWAKTLQSMGILQHQVQEGRLVWAVTEAGSSPLTTVRLIGRHASRPLKGPLSTRRPTDVRVIREIHAAALEIEEKLEEREVVTHSTDDLKPTE